MTHILINGEYNETISVLDRGLHYGDGLFETLKVLRGRPLFLEQHLQRLRQGCERLRLAQPQWNALREETQILAKDAERAVLKILLTRGQGGRGYRIAERSSTNRIIIRYPFPHYPEHFYRHGVEVRMCDTRLAANPQLAGIKHLNRLEQVLARSEWQEESIAEGLMMDHNGHIVEATMSNVFLVGNGRLCTPDVKTCGIAGIMRQQVLDMAQDLGISHDITEVKKSDLLTASEIFLTNSVIGIWPVRKVLAEAYIDYKIGPVTEKLMQTLAGLEMRQEGSQEVRQEV